MAWLNAKSVILVGAVVVAIVYVSTQMVHLKKLRAERLKDPIAFVVHHHPPITDTEKLRSQMIGTWEMFATRSWGAQEVTYLPQDHRHFKTFTETNWSVVAYDANSNVVMSIGGVYTLNGNDYHESIDTATGDMVKYLHAHPEFKVCVEGDKYYQIGGGKKNPNIEEIWQRAK